MKWTETITPKQAVEELGVPYRSIRETRVCAPAVCGY